MKIKIKLIRNWCEIEVSKKGEWIDLRSGAYVTLKPPIITSDGYCNYCNIATELIPLGIAMKLPKHFEANIVPRSSTFANFGMIQGNSMGVVDSSYCGDTDEWKFMAVSLRGGIIQQGDRIAQFRIRPSQFAPWWIKFKWLFTSRIKFKYVDSLNSEARGGFGSTGIK